MLKFICIGAQKAGTTWLYNVLKEHPEVYLPPVKEINFFYEIHLGINSNLREKFLARHWMSRRWRRLVRTELLNYRLTDKEREWYFEYLFTKPSLSKKGFQFYKSLFENEEIKISGDITPNYSLLPLKMIESIKSNLPDQKILFILRNPTERDWSALKMNLGIRRGIPINKIGPKKIQHHFKKINVRSKYSKIINNWAGVYGYNMKILFYDELKLNPHSFFKKVCDFLEVKSTVKIKTLDEKIFTGIQKKIPEDHLRQLSKMYYPILCNLAKNKHIDDVSFINSWIENCENFL